MRDSRLGQIWCTRSAPQLERCRSTCPALALSASQTVSGVPRRARRRPRRPTSSASWSTSSSPPSRCSSSFATASAWCAALRDLIPMEPDDKDAILARFYETLSAVVHGSRAHRRSRRACSAASPTGGSASRSPSCWPARRRSSRCCRSAARWSGSGSSSTSPSTGDYVRAAIMVGWGTIVIGSADNVIRPLIIGGRTQIPTRVSLLRHPRRPAGVRLPRHVPRPGGDRHPGRLRPHLPRAVRRRPAEATPAFCLTSFTTVGMGRRPRPRHVTECSLATDLAAESNRIFETEVRRARRGVAPWVAPDDATQGLRAIRIP